jgi:hypothetical protein
MVIVTVTMVGLAAYLIAGDVRQKREWVEFRERMAVRVKGPWVPYEDWHPEVRPAPEVEG